MREAVQVDIDFVVLASRDTDLVPVLDERFDFRRSEPGRYAKVETVAWFDAQASEEGRYAGVSLRPTGARRIWNTNMGRDCYDASLDRRDYQ